MISPRTRAIVLSVAGALLLSPAAVHADTIAVDITSDDFDVVPDADCSVREAVQTANVDANFGGCAQTGTSSGPDTITIPAGTYTLTGAAGENLNLSGDLDIVNVQGQANEGGDLTLAGAGDDTDPLTDTILVASTAPDRVIDVQSDGPTGMDLAVDDVRIQDGSVTGNGGGIKVGDANGSVTVNRSTLSGNDASGDGGGLVLAGGTVGSSHQVQVIDTEFDQNTAGGEGGGLFVQVASPNPSGSNSAEVDGSTFSQNGAAEAGGAIYAEGAMRLDLLNSTLHGNQATGGGGAVAFGSINPEFHSQFSTIYGNSTPLAAGAGGIQTDADSDLIYLEGTILAFNKADNLAKNCAEISGAGADGVFHSTSLGYSLEDGDDCELDDPGDQINTNPQISSLTDNGGETRTQMPVIGGPVIGYVPNGPIVDYCHYTEVPSTTTVDLTQDQRGLPRATAADEFCDIGAVERQIASSRPTITDTDPDSPASIQSPFVKGTASADSVTIRFYQQTDCLGPVEASGSATSFEGAGIQVGVPANQTTSISANAVGLDGGLPSACSNSITYTHDGIALAPSITATNPASGSSDNSPEVIGTAEANSTVRLYFAGSCPAGTPLVSGSSAAFTTTGLTISVADNSTTSIEASYTDQAGNTSVCSSPFSYLEVTPLPAATTPAPTTTKKKCKKRKKHRSAASAKKKCKKHKKRK